VARDLWRALLPRKIDGSPGMDPSCAPLSRQITLLLMPCLARRRRERITAAAAGAMGEGGMREATGLGARRRPELLVRTPPRGRAFGRSCETELLRGAAPPAGLARPSWVPPDAAQGVRRPQLVLPLLEELRDAAPRSPTTRTADSPCSVVRSPPCGNSSAPAMIATRSVRSLSPFPLRSASSPSRVVPLAWSSRYRASSWAPCLHHGPRHRPGELLSVHRGIQNSR
jgi:hypothetical protein